MTDLHQVSVAELKVVHNQGYTAKL